MQTNTRDLGFVNFNGQEMNFVNYNGVTVYEAWKELIAKGIPPLTLLKCKQANLLDYKIYGESLQEGGTPTPETPIEIESVGEKTENIFDCFMVTANDHKLQSAVLTNNHGTTINSTQYIGEIIVTQSKYPGTNNGLHYENGYFTIGLNGLEVGKKYTLLYDFEILSNPLNNDSQVIINGGVYIEPTIKGNRAKYVIEWVNNTYSSLEFRLKGKSMKYTNFMIIEGEVADYPEYVPVGYRIPIKIRGKNQYKYPLGAELMNGGTIEKIENGFKLTPNNKTGISSSGVIPNTYGRFDTGYVTRKNIYLTPGVHTFSFDVELLEPNSINDTGTQIFGFISDNANELGTEMTGATIDFSNGRKSYTITLQSAKWVTFMLRLNGMTINMTNIQLEKHKNLLPFPYEDKTKTVEGVTYIVNNYRGLSVSGTTTNYSSFIFGTIPIKENTKYLISGFKGAVNISVEHNLNDINGNIITNIQTSGEDLIINTADYPTAKSMRLNIKRKSNNTVTTGMLYPCIVELVEPTYEPYIEPITTNIYLDEPLREIRGYADYIDFEKQQVVRNIASIDYDGSSDEIWSIYRASTATGAYYGFQTKNEIGRYTKELNCMCNRLSAQLTYSYIWYGEALGCFVGNNNAVVDTSMTVISSEKSKTVDELRVELAEKPINVIFIRRNEKIEEIELPIIATHKGTNIIEIDTTIQPSNMEVVYLGKK